FIWIEGDHRVQLQLGSLSRRGFSSSSDLSRILLYRFPYHQATEDAVLIGDELEVGVQLEGDISGVPTADIDFVGLEKIVQNFKHASHTIVPLFFADFFQRLFTKVFVVILSLMHRMLRQFEVW